MIDTFYTNVLMTIPSSRVSDLLVERLDVLLHECNLVIDSAERGRTFHNLDDFFCTNRPVA